MSTADWQMPTSPFTMTGSLGRTSGGAYGNFFRPTPTENPVLTSRTFGVPGSMRADSAKSEKYATVTASDIQKIVDATLAGEGPRPKAMDSAGQRSNVMVSAGQRSNVMDSSGHMQSLSEYNRTTSRDPLARSVHSAYSRHPNPSLFTSAMSRPLSSASDVLPSSTASLVSKTTRAFVPDGSRLGLDRANTTLGLTSSVSSDDGSLVEYTAAGKSFSSGFDRMSTSEKPPGTPYHGFDRLSSATTSLSRGLQQQDKDGSAMSSASQYISDKASYNTHQKYTSSDSRHSAYLDHTNYMNTSAKPLGYSALDYPLTKAPTSGFDLENKKFASSAVDARSSLTSAPSYRLYGTRTKTSMDSSPVIIPASDSSHTESSPSSLSSSVTSNSSRYAEPGIKFHAPVPPPTPHPGRLMESSVAFGDINSSIKDVGLEDSCSRSMSSSRTNGININSNIGTSSLSPRDKIVGSDTTSGHFGVNSAIGNTNLFNSESISRHSASPVSSAALPYSTASGKRSILKKVSSYAGDMTIPRALSAYASRDIPILNGMTSYRSEKLPPLAALSATGSGSVRRPASKRVTFNMGHNTSHWYEAAEYEEPYHNPYLW